MTTRIKIKQRDLGKFEMAKQMILQDIKVHYTIQQLSAASNLNEFKLKTGFRTLYNSTIYDFLQNERMARALHLLRTSDDNIQNIANECGYGYATNFIAVFHRKFKITPTNYRRSQAIVKTFRPGTLQRCYNEVPVGPLQFNRLSSSENYQFSKIANS
jgi:AraC-like DNA-binding protein